MDIPPPRKGCHQGADKTPSQRRFPCRYGQQPNSRGYETKDFEKSGDKARVDVTMVRTRGPALGPPVPSPRTSIGFCFSSISLAPVPIGPNHRNRSCFEPETWERTSNTIYSLGRKRPLPRILPPRNRISTEDISLGKKMRTVRSGKVYRQIFDDEVQLVRSLAESRKKASEHPGSLKSGKIPTIRDTEIHPGQLLSPRQKMWAHSMPNDTNTENPVLFRELQDAAIEKARENQHMITVREVRGLTDTIVPEKINSDIIQRLEKKKRENHESNLKNLWKEISDIAMETESLIMEPGQELLTQLAKNDAETETLFKEIESDVEQQTFEIQNLWELWDKLNEKFTNRRKWIKNFDETLKKIEAGRAEKLGEVLKKYMNILKENAYLLYPDIDRLIHKEAMNMNQALLGNQRAIAKLFINMMESNLKQEISNHNRWQDVIKHWKNIQKDLMIQNLRDILPPFYSRDKLNQWHASFQALNKDLEYCIMDGMTKIRLQNEENWWKCLNYLSDRKKQLLKWKVFSREEIENSISPYFYQIVGNLQSQVEKDLETMMESLEEKANWTEIMSEDLFKYLETTLQLWEVHHNQLVMEDLTLEKKIEQQRYKQNYENELKEACLDIVLDQMRQQNNEDSLKSYLDKVRFLLHDIKKKYKRFHEDALLNLKSYPFSVLKALKSYSTSLSQYFCVREIYEKTMEGEVIIRFREPEELLQESPSYLKDIIKSFFKFESDSKISFSMSRVTTVPSKIISEPLQEEASEIPKIPSPLREPTELGISDLDDFTEDVTQESWEIMSSYQVPIITEAVREEESTIATSEEEYETFITSSGNKYLAFSLSEEAERKKLFQQSDVVEETDTVENFAPYLEHVDLPFTLFSKLKKEVRFELFEHLEKWFGQCLTNSIIIVDAKTEELNSELELKLHLHKSRFSRIRMDVHNVRAAEITFHQERLDRHCASIMDTLQRERLLFYKFSEEQSNKNRNFRNWMASIEQAFFNSTTSRKLSQLSASLHRELLSYVDVMQVSLRGFRQYVEENMEKLRIANMGFIKRCRLFSEGGNFSSEELSSFCGRLEKESSRIEFVESFIVLKMEKMESDYVDQANDIINKFESKFHNLSVDLIFMEKIQRFFTNLQVNLKSEVCRSNFQTETLNNALQQLHHKISICGHEFVDQKTVTAEEVYSFSRQLMDKIARRIHYLNCQTEAQSSGVSTEKESVLFQSPSEEETKVDMMKELLLQPSRMGKPMTEDTALEVIKNILQLPEQKRDREHVSKAKGKRSRRRTESIIATLKKVTSVASSSSQASALRYSRPNRQDKKYQVFGDRPERTDHFKSIIRLLLWEGNDTLLAVAEDFYRKEKHSVTRPEFMQDTFDQCADVFAKKLLEYENQTEDYHNACLIELRDQLKEFEEQLPHVAELVMENFLHRHWDSLQTSKAEIQGRFNEQLKKWLQTREKNKQELQPDLGHPYNSKTLASLCAREEKRQKEQDTGILSTSEKLEECAKKCARKFISSLASLTERFLQQLDEVFTVDDVQIAKSDLVRQKLSVLMRRKMAGLPLDDEREKPQGERGNKKWRGIIPTPFTSTSKIFIRATPTIITTKNTPGHQAVVKARDAVYLKYLNELQLDMKKIVEEKDMHMANAESWKNWWNTSVIVIKGLYP
ncbi:coiled-coil domain-containing protein 180 isoform X2 [Monodelphis domestica]|uniref:coiled-coil domain-containing protein 180 isoform X2 n=1 Tax=Monodelphis domestica TaxID=13616 RepID=UPI0024E21D18|nr:coiled-coil domain-containing protein 180 isoform X2 [Monodelphis domestica]